MSTARRSWGSCSTAAARSWTPRIVQGWDVIRGTSLPDGHVVVADFRSDWVGLGLATPVAGQRIQQYVRGTMTATTRRARVDIRPTCACSGPTGPRCGLLVELEAAAAAGAGFEVHAVGDVLSPRTIEEAVLEGLRAGVAV